jgi:hypothetical protein
MFSEMLPTGVTLCTTPESGSLGSEIVCGVKVTDVAACAGTATNRVAVSTSTAVATRERTFTSDLLMDSF